MNNLTLLEICRMDRRQMRAFFNDNNIEFRNTDGTTNLRAHLIQLWHEEQIINNNSCASSLVSLNEAENGNNMPILEKGDFNMSENENKIDINENYEIIEN